ncbi:MAG TPA: ubiquitin-like protein Pup [Acidimicrobiia bacterium]|nr:ubiquitin-like protein Pup [Acidimicrobiia bacterium]
MKQERVAPARPRKSHDAEAVEEMVVEENDVALLDDIDALLDEIDAVLEDQAVLIGYRQRSGQ